MTDADGVELHPAVASLYAAGIERDRLATKNRLEWLRTTDILSRYLPNGGRVLDVGGGPGWYAAWLADRGFEVCLVDPVPLHVTQAQALADGGGSSSFDAQVGDARQLPFPDDFSDVVLLMGPLYHLVDRADRSRALTEARRALRAGGTLIAVAIGRYAWFADALARNLIVDARIAASVVASVETGMSTTEPVAGSFYAYFHRPAEFVEEIKDAGFEVQELLAVEGPATWLVDVNERLDQPESTAALLDMLATVERDPMAIDVSSHLILVARRD